MTKTTERTIEITAPSPVTDRAATLAFLPVGNLRLVPVRLWRCAGLDEGTIGRIYHLSDAALLYGLLDSTYELHGVLWLRLDPVAAELSVYAFGVDPDYDDGLWVGRVTRWVFQQNLPQAVKPQLGWRTNRPETFTTLGATPDPVQVMVFTRGGKP